MSFALLNLAKFIRSQESFSSFTDDITIRSENRGVKKPYKIAYFMNNAGIKFSFSEDSGWEFYYSNLGGDNIVISGGYNLSLVKKHLEENIKNNKDVNLYKFWLECVKRALNMFPELGE